MSLIVKTTKKPTGTQPSVVLSVTKQRQRTQRRRRRNVDSRVQIMQDAMRVANKMSGLSRPAANFAKAYIRTLADPFSNGPINLGFGTMVPTALATAYARGTLLVGASGDAGIFLWPSLGATGSLFNPIYTNVAGGTTWDGTAFANTTSIEKSMAEARVVSCGIRAFALVKQTEAPGTVYCGQINSATLTDVVARSAHDLTDFQGSSWGLSQSGGASMGRPLDLESYHMKKGNVTLSANTLPNFSIPYVVFQGLPSGTHVTFEAVLNLEGVGGILTGGAATNDVPGATGKPAPAASDYFPSIDSLWSKVKNFIPPASEFSATLQDIVSTSVGRMANSYANPSGYGLLRDEL